MTVWQRNRKDNNGKIKITAEDGEIIELFVIEQTRLEGINYLLVTETEDEEAEAYILKIYRQMMIKKQCMNLLMMITNWIHLQNYFQN